MTSTNHGSNGDQPHRLPNAEDCLHGPLDLSALTPALGANGTFEGVSVCCHGLTPEEQLQTQHLAKLFLVQGPASIPASWNDSSHQTHHLRVEAQQAWVLAPNVPYSVAWPDDIPILSIVFAESIHREALMDDLPLPPSTVEPIARLSARDILIQELADAFRPLCAPDTAVSRRYIECMAHVLTTRILQVRFGPELPMPRLGGLPTEILHQVTAFIHAHLKQGFDLDALARLSGFSTDHFSRLFKKSMGLGPKRYFLECQIYRGEELILNTDWSIDDIAHEVGFINQTVFGRWFKKIRKKKPTDLRR